jgi:hypothetical protein
VRFIEINEHFWSPLTVNYLVASIQFCTKRNILFFNLFYFIFYFVLIIIVQNKKKDEFELEVSENKVVIPPPPQSKLKYIHGTPELLRQGIVMRGLSSVKG